MNRTDPRPTALTPDAEFGIPSGMGYAISAETGKAVLIYTSTNQNYTSTNQTTPTLPAPAPQPNPVQQVVVHTPARDPWPARILASGGTLAGITTAVGHYAPQLGQLGHAIQTAGIGIGIAAAGLYVLKGAAPKVSVTINSTITGANASSTASSNARSAAGWKNQA